jgi:hypothetical protein
MVEISTGVLLFGVDRADYGGSFQTPAKLVAAFVKARVFLCERTHAAARWSVRSYAGTRQVRLRRLSRDLRNPSRSMSLSARG